MTLKVEMWPVNKLAEYARNPRKNDAQVERMVSAIKEFGFRIPIVVTSDGTIVDGHLRYKAARRLEMEEVPVALADDLSEAQVKAFRILANRSANWAQWDNELLQLEFRDLTDWNFDLQMTGFNGEEILNILNEPQGGPEPAPDTSGGYSEQYGVIVMCHDEAHQEHVYNKLMSEGYSVKVVAT